jgi:hypothetical protein
MSNIGAAHTTGYCNIVATHQSANLFFGSPYDDSANSGALSIISTAQLPMTAGDTASVSLAVSGGTKIVGVGRSSYSGPGTLVATFSGYLVC